MIIGPDTLAPKVTFTPPKLSRLANRMRVYDCCGFQGWGNPLPEGVERGYACAGEGVTYDAQQRPTVDVEAVVRAAQASEGWGTKLFSLDVEGAVDPTSLWYTRMSRYVHREVFARTNIEACVHYSESAALPSPYGDRKARLAAMTNEDGVRSKGLLRGGNIVWGQFYPDAAMIADEYASQAAVESIVAESLSVRVPGQLAGLWTTPANVYAKPPGTPEGYDRSTPLPWRYAAKLVKWARQAGGEVLGLWMWESRHSDQNEEWPETFGKTYVGPLEAMYAAA